RFGNGRVLVGVNESETEFDTVQETGGEKTHTLTIAEMPSHNHGIYDYGNGYDGMDYYVSYEAHLHKGYLSTKNTGDGQPHNNLQPYITVYIWRRAQ
ncbi:MAG: hypothetical protein LBT45_02530, partial [Rickettsiales bacterium]|nr:hypothetical protein [Rickettsiales bacterium]